MNCEELQSALPELIYGSLPDDEAQAANAHLARCATCNLLCEELRPIPGALPKPAPPPDLLAEIKLAARDELLDQQLESRRGPLHLIVTIVLATCLAVVGFALGRNWDQQPDPDKDGVDGGRSVITYPDDDDPGGGTGDPRKVEGTEALQRMLVDAAHDYLKQREYERARDYSARARDLAPEGPSAARARAGEAEALIALERKDEARSLVRETRALILAGDLRADAELLQRLYTLEEQAERK